MAISVVSANRGTATEKVSDTSLTLTPSANLSSGNYAILGVVADNGSTSEGNTNDISASDNGPGATWTKLYERTEANTAALTGCTVALFMAQLSSNLTTSHTITITFANAATAKGAGLAELSGSNVVLSTSGATGANVTANATGTATLSSLTSVAGLYIGLGGAEEELSTAVTPDAAFTTLFGGTIGSGTSGANLTNVIGQAGYRAETSTGRSYVVGADGTAADRATLIVRLEEGSAPSAAPPPHAVMARGIA